MRWHYSILRSLGGALLGFSSSYLFGIAMPPPVLLIVIVAGIAMLTKRFPQ
jgi:hypothetical protein